jgi:hypothetical protein
MGQQMEKQVFIGFSIFILKDTKSRAAIDDIKIYWLIRFRSQLASVSEVDPSALVQTRIL